ncbi:hypothetical protein V8F06_005871 [Rhypophila decipiens]
MHVGDAYGEATGHTVWQIHGELLVGAILGLGIVVQGEHFGEIHWMMLSERRVEGGGSPELVHSTPAAGDAGVISLVRNHFRSLLRFNRVRGFVFALLFHFENLHLDLHLRQHYIL